MPTKKETWTANFNEFTKEMKNKIKENMKEKGLSWRNMDDFALRSLIRAYFESQNYTDVANICFMLWENKKVKS